MRTVDRRAVVRKLAAGLPKQRIALQAGASVRTIERIADGSRQEKFSRCPGCGGKQVMPCRVCQVRTVSAAA